MLYVFKQLLIFVVLMYSPFDPKCKRGLAENDENAIVCCNVLLRIADKLHVRRSIKSLVTTVLGK